MKRVNFEMQLHLRNQKNDISSKTFAFSRFRHTIINISHFMLFPKLIRNNNLVMVSSNETARECKLFRNHCKKEKKKKKERKKERKKKTSTTYLFSCEK